MPNKGNLIPNSERTPKERKENARKAGIASGAARRKKRDAQAAARLVLGLPCSKENQAFLQKYGVQSEDWTNIVAIMAKAYAKAQEGDVRAMQFLVDAAGESPKQKLAEDMHQYRKERDAGKAAELEDLDEAEAFVYGSQSGTAQE